MPSRAGIRNYAAAARLSVLSAWAFVSACSRPPIGTADIAPIAADASGGTEGSPEESSATAVALVPEAGRSEGEPNSTAVADATGNAGGPVRQGESFFQPD
jgi:hypothetical protein